jgi:hypothetical protein
MTDGEVVVRLYRALCDQSYDDADDWSLALALLDEWMIDLHLAIEDGHEHDQVRLATSARLAAQTLREALLALVALQEPRHVVVAMPRRRNHPTIHRQPPEPAGS